MRKLVIVSLSLSVCLILFTMIVSNLAFAQKKYHEALMLSKLVESGKLPPISDRLPEEPWVIEPVDKIGKYGGTLRAVTLTVAHWCDADYPRCPYLFFTDEKAQKVVPQLAKGYSFSKDYKTLTIYLRKGLKWSDGHPFTTEDILFWWNDVILNDELTPVKPKLWSPGGKLARFEKVDDYTLRIRFSVPYRPILGALGYHLSGQQSFFHPKHYVRRWHIKYNPDATNLAKKEGFEHWWQAFQFHADRGPGQQDTEIPVLGAWILKERNATRKIYERNPYFCGVDSKGNQLPYIDRIIVEIVSSPEVVNMKILAGELDYVGLPLEVENYSLYKGGESKGGYRVLLWQSSVPSEAAFGFNLNHRDPILRKIFQDVRFRRAMSLAINRQEINEFAYNGMGVPSQATAHPSCSFYEEEWGKAYADYDPAKANKLLDEMGLKRGRDGYRLRPDGKPLAITIQWGIGGGQRGLKTVSELVKKYWEDIGIKVALTEIDRTLFGIRSRGGELDVGVWGAECMLELRSYIPGMTNLNPRGDHGWAVNWGLWYETGGKSGEEPNNDVKEFLDAFDRWYLAANDSEYSKWAKRIFDIQASNLYLIGTVGLAKCPIVIKNSLHNVPAEAIWGDDLSWWRVAYPEQWFFE